VVGTPGFGARIHYPDGTADQLALTEQPEVGKTVSLRASRWLIADVQLASPAEQVEGLLYDVWVRAVEAVD
jgi:hypothetical protein